MREIDKAVVLEPHVQPGVGSLRWPLFGAAVLVAVALAGSLLQAPLVLPAVSGLLLAAGFGLAVMALFSGAGGDKRQGSAWAVAGALVFLGFAAALLSDGDQTLAVLDGMLGVQTAGAVR